MIFVRRLIVPMALVALVTGDGAWSRPAFQPQAAPAYAPPTVNPGTPMTRDRFLQRGRQRMMRLDTDHDGRINLKEFAARGAHRRGDAGRDERSPRDPSRAFNRYDANHDGFLEPAEIDAMLARRFQRRDANRDGVITPGERPAGRAAAPRR